MGTTTTGENRENYAATVEPRPSRFDNEGKEYRAWSERADAYATLIAVTLSAVDTAHNLGQQLTCIEVDAIAHTLSANGKPDIAQHWIEAHAQGDDEGDNHRTGEDEFYYVIYDLVEHETRVASTDPDAIAEIKAESYPEARYLIATL